MIQVAESNRDFYIFLSHACIKCPLQRRHHERYSKREPRRENRMIRTLTPVLSKVLKSTRFVGTCGIFTHHVYSSKAPHPRRQKIHVYTTTLPASWAEIARRPSLLIARASFGGGGFSKSQYEQHAAAAATTASRYSRTCSTQ